MGSDLLQDPEMPHVRDGALWLDGTLLDRSDIGQSVAQEHLTCIKERVGRCMFVPPKISKPPLRPGERKQWHCASLHLRDQRSAWLRRSLN